MTYRRRAFLTTELARQCLRQALDNVRDQRPFDVLAFCLLPEHLHCVWQLPPSDDAYSLRWSLIKHGFTSRYLRAGGRELAQGPSRIGKGERGVWQRRFWEHVIRDERDLQQHVDYIHFNPVRHGLVVKAEEWQWSTYRRYLDAGWYAGRNLSTLQHELDDLVPGE